MVRRRSIDEHALARGTALLIEKGSVRAIHAGTEGIRYLTVHRRRGPLQVSGLAGSAERPPADVR